MPAGSSAVAPSGTIACLRLAVAQRLGVEAAAAARSRARIAAIFSSSASSRTSSRPGEARRRPRRSGRRRSGPSPPLVTIRSHALVGAGTAAPPRGPRGGRRRRGCGRPRRRARQPLGEPGAVAVGDPAGEHLGAGDDDAGANAPRSRAVRPWTAGPRLVGRRAASIAIARPARRRARPALGLPSSVSGHGSPLPRVEPEAVARLEGPSLRRRR